VETTIRTSPVSTESSDRSDDPPIASESASERCGSVLMNVTVPLCEYGLPAFWPGPPTSCTRDTVTAAWFFIQIPSPPRSPWIRGRVSTTIESVARQVTAAADHPADVVDAERILDLAKGVDERPARS
jgi:hypothetical protein